MTLFPNSRQVKPEDFIALTTEYSLGRYGFRNSMAQAIPGALDVFPKL